MEVIYDYLYQISAVFFFCFALVILIVSSRNLNLSILTTKAQMKQSNTLYEMGCDVSDNEVDSLFTKEELISYLLSDIECDVTLDDIIIEDETFQPLCFDYSIIQDKNYRKTCIYKEDGELLKIEFITK